MAAAIPPNPRMYYRDQPYLNGIFAHFRLSFEDPNFIVETMTDMILTHLGSPRFMNERQFFHHVERSNCSQLWDLMQEIGALPLHRHRVDARNILAEVRSRVSTRNAPRTLIPRPMERDYEGPDRLQPGEAPEADAEALVAFYRRMVLEGATQLVWQAGDRLPTAWEAEWTDDEQVTYVPPNNADALELIVQRSSRSRNARNAIFNILSANPPPNLRTPPVFLDNPSEVCLQLPENCPFLNSPTPASARITRALAGQLYELEVWDNRLGEIADIGPLSRNHYIHRLVSLVRDVVRQPDVARAYAIIFRADPTRYGVNSNDELADEPPPTDREGINISPFIPDFIGTDIHA